jgi:Ca2+-binding RTX toxin-like protein
MPNSLAEFQTIFQQLQNRAVRLNVSPNAIFLSGTAGNDLIEPPEPPNQTGLEQIAGNGGDDIIYGLRSGDIIYGDLRGDAVSNVVPNDLSTVVSGNDIIFGDDGNTDGDLFNSALGGADGIRADLGDDWVFGEAGNDVIYGGPVRGNFSELYRVNARRDRDHLYGGAGNDFIIGGYDSDFLVGGQGNDSLVGSSGRSGQHEWDGIDILWGDEENGNGSSGADIFILGERGERYYDDNFTSDISSISQGRGHYALIKDFNASAGDKIRLASLSSGEYQTKLTTPAREFLNGADNPNALGTAIYYDDGSGIFKRELLAFVEGNALLSLDSSSVVYS